MSLQLTYVHKLCIIGTSQRKGKIMATLIGSKPSNYSPAEAERAAAALQSGDSDWSYTAIHKASGDFSRVEIRDENNEFVRHW